LFCDAAGSSILCIGARFLSLYFSVLYDGKKKRESFDLRIALDKVHWNVLLHLWQ
jgi:hypothetical protein